RGGGEVVWSSDSPRKFGCRRRAELLLCASLGRTCQKSLPAAALGDEGKNASGTAGAHRDCRSPEILRAVIAASLPVRSAGRFSRRDTSQSPGYTATGSNRRRCLFSLLASRARPRHSLVLRAGSRHRPGTLAHVPGRRAEWSA